VATGDVQRGTGVLPAKAEQSKTRASCLGGKENVAAGEQ